MTIVNVRKSEKRGAELAYIKCDNCGTIKTKYLCQVEGKELHFCSRPCQHQSNSTDMLKEQIKETNLYLYGSTTPAGNPDVQAKTVNTNLERYGVPRPTMNKDVQAKQIATNLEHWGVEWPLSLPEIQEKRKATCMQTMGVEYPSQSEVGLQHAKETSIERFGVEYYSQSEECKKRKEETNLKKHGVTNTFQLPEARAKAHSKEARVKAHETKKRNGTYSKPTKPENWCYEALCSVYGVDNVVRWPIVNGWSIDLYVKSIDTYLQVDGVWYHGLDRPVEVIEEHKYDIDQIILSTRIRDTEQNVWFKSEGIRLSRVTDLEVKEWKKYRTLTTNLISRLGI